MIMTASQSSKQYKMSERRKALENMKVRRAARAAGIPLWKIAVAIGVSEPTLTRWLRVPLSCERETAIMDAISRLEMRENG